jgi:peptidase M23-like protein
MRRLLLTSGTVVLAFLLLAPPAWADWVWPLRGEVITPYRNGSDPYASGQHRGIDIAGAVGESVVAAASGEVRFAGTAGASGLTVSVRTADGRYDTSYLHLSSTAVREGDHVAAGQRVGTVGTTGTRSVSEPHLHFGVRDAGSRHAYHDPLTFLPPPGTTSPPRGAPVPRPAPVPVSPAPAPIPVLAPAVGRVPVAAPAPRLSPVPHRVPGGAPRRIPTGAPRRTPAEAPRRVPAGDPRRVPTGAPRQLPAGAPRRIAAGEPQRVPAGEQRAPTGEPHRVPGGEPQRAPTGELQRFVTGEPNRVPAAPRRVPASELHQHPASEPQQIPAGGPNRVLTGPPRSVPEDGGAPRHGPQADLERGEPSPSGPDLGLLAACLGLLAAAAILGLTPDGRKATRGTRHRLARVLQPMFGRR